MENNGELIKIAEEKYQALTLFFPKQFNV